MLLSTVQGILLLFTVGLNLHIFYLYLKLQQQMHLLSERLPLQQELMDQAFTEIHNNSLQQLAFVIRELQIREMSQQELIEYLRQVYQDIQTSVENLKE
ncbi:hypothetical protein [Moorena sp. SIO4G3]|uniref:hypothetical protein n=1 Tax=Moorena sp. SIO4G3 TaxID=2607821 RepID=UPI00142BFEC1|nr:hypothetical protein [Moorena sp. SIO4G3]NEO76727.1 hypothetical protein [Moorena sp. SIO4G3]